ncbi:hypothetical protein IEQ34_009330 [Dendrobium chrysotoxum]|uniref:Uncharacterized protein n=1 Tax=Dendrobium chrysotoxum TaxID=161865 RepID=A0AAV7H0D9_DENCH|nr:hypothetical protein IEQ34_009330 [Dendrobium chrysotoxum]
MLASINGTPRAFFLLKAFHEQLFLLGESHSIVITYLETKLVLMESITNGSKYECLLFDMDDTLYPLCSGINLACRKNIQDYMREHLNIEESLVPRMCLDLYKEYGTTMAGLKALGYNFDDDEFHAYVHGRLPYEILKPDPVLKNLLLSMPQRKLIFTNADKAHVERVLNRLGLEDCFHGVICFETLNSAARFNDDGDENHAAISSLDGVDQKELDVVDSNLTVNKTTGFAKILCKPAVEAIETAIRIAKINPKKTIFFDDSARNIAAGKAAGLNTVIVGSSGLVPGADHTLESIHNIKEALPEIWEGEEEKDLMLTSAAVELETVVQA